MSKASAAAASQPASVTAAALAAAVGLPAAALYSAAYGGYAGNLSAKNTLALLQVGGSPPPPPCARPEPYLNLSAFAHVQSELSGPVASHHGSAGHDDEPRTGLEF